MSESQRSLGNRAGRWEKAGVGSEAYRLFIPHPLPPQPPVHYDEGFQDLTERANRALGQLEGVASFIPSVPHFLYMYVRKEAVLSSQIEGTQSSLSDLLLFEMKEMPGVPVNDVQEVSNYVAAMEHGLKRLKEGFPLSLRLIKEIHAILLRHSRGSDKEPGAFRRSQNWIGGSRPGNALYVPPPPHEVLPAMGALEKFLHGEPVKVPMLIRAGLAHAQFESIHPFLDGNGRLGRLLITFVLCAEGALSQPLLYLSLYFKQNRAQYYEVLQRVRTDGDWEGWLNFYLTGVESVALEASQAAKTIVSLFERHQRQIQGLGKATASALGVHDLLKRHGVISLSRAQKELKVSFPTANHAMKNLQQLGIVKEFTGKARHRLFGYDAYLKIMAEGTNQ